MSPLVGDDEKQVAHDDDAYATRRNLLSSFETEYETNGCTIMNGVIVPVATSYHHKQKQKKRPRPDLLAKAKLENLIERRQQNAWQQIEDKLLIALEGNEKLLHIFRQYAGVQISWPYLSSMAQLVVARFNERTRQQQQENKSTFNLIIHSATEDSLDRLSILFGTGRFSRVTKRACLRTLLQCLTPDYAKWQLVDNIVEETLDFLITPEQEWELLQHSEEILLWELRARSLHQQRIEQKRLEKVARVGNTAAFGIASSAKLVESGLAYSVPYLTCSIDYVGQKLKPRIRAEEYPLFMSKTAVLALTYSNAAKRGSEAARNAAWKMNTSIRETSSRGVNQLLLISTNPTNSNNHQPQYILLSPECKQILQSMGHVGWTTLGALTIVGDAVLEVGNAVIGKTSQVTAEIVAYKYGTSAGQVVLDIGDATQNTIRTVGHVAFLWGESATVAQAVAKHNAKTLAGETAENGLETIYRFPTRQAVTPEKSRNSELLANTASTNSKKISVPSPTTVAIEELR